MLSKSRRLRAIAKDPNFVKKLQRMETLSIRLGKLLGHSTFTLQKSLRHPEGMWKLDVDWSYYGIDTVVELKRRVKGWVRYKWLRVMEYHLDYGTDTHEEKRHLFTFETSVVAVLDILSDELEEQITKAAQATEEHREQFSKVVEGHPRVEKNRFDDIDLAP